MMKFPLFCTYD